MKSIGIIVFSSVVELTTSMNDGSFHLLKFSFIEYFKLVIYFGFSVSNLVSLHFCSSNLWVKLGKCEGSYLTRRPLKKIELLPVSVVAS